MTVVACAMPAIDAFPVTSISVDGVDLSVWLADESSERRQGLRNVDQLPAGIDGMLFSYDRSGSVTFVMDDVLIPLDVWWFDEDGVLIATTEMSPCESLDCGDYESPGPVTFVLETSQGRHDFPVGAVLSSGESG